MDIPSQANITVATDLPPIVTNSSVECANLNANLLQGNEASAFAAASHSHSASQIIDSTYAGRALLTAADYTAQLQELALTHPSGTPTVNLDAVANHKVRINSGGTVSTRRQLNLIQGSNISLSIADDSGTGETDVTISATPVVSGGNWGLTLFGWCVAVWDGSAWQLHGSSNVSSITVPPGEAYNVTVNFTNPHSFPFHMEGAIAPSNGPDNAAYVPMLWRDSSTSYTAFVVLTYAGLGHFSPVSTGTVLSLKFWTTT